MLIKLGKFFGANSDVDERFQHGLGFIKASLVVWPAVIIRAKGSQRGLGRRDDGLLVFDSVI